MGYMDLALSYSNKMRIVEAPASGGGLSQNGKFSYGYASSAGKRSSMEDFFETRIDGIDGEIVGLFGVFDGHGGARAAEYVKRHLFSNLITHPKFISDTKSAIADAYNHTDSELLKSENSHTRDAGSTASTAILVGDRLLVANVGDSRAVICRSGNAFAVSRDHKPDQSDERERIENAGGFVMWAGTWRVGGVLAVSRAFGDRLLKQYVVADPEIQEEKIDDSLEFLILASDGLWDVFSNEEAVAVVKEVEEPEESTKKLVGEAIRRGSADNITCVVVRFLESKTGNKKASEISSSTQASSSQEAIQGQGQDHKISAKQTNQDNTALQNDLDRDAENQKPIEISVSSEQSGSAGGKNQMPISIRSGSESKSSAKQFSQEQITAHNNFERSIGNQKPAAVIAAGHTTFSEQSKSTAEKNRIGSGSESKSSAKQSGQEQIRENNNLDRSIANQKPVAAGGKTIAAAHSTSSEQSKSTGEKNRISSCSEPKSSTKQPGQGQKNTVHDNLDRSTANQKPLTSNVAAHTTSSEQSGLTGEKKQKPIAVHSESATSKASSVPSIFN